MPILHTQVALVTPTDDVRMLVSVPYSSTGKGPLFIIDLHTSTVNALPFAEAAPAVVASPDGRSAYLGGSSGRVWHLDVTTQALTEVARVTDETIVTGFRSTSEKLYFGTAPGGIVVEYDPATGTHHEYHYLRASAPAQQQVRVILDLPDGRVLALITATSADQAGTAQPTALLLTPGAGTWERQSVDVLLGDDTITQAALHADGTILVACHSGRLLRLDGASLAYLGEAPALPEVDRVHCLHRVGDALLASATPSGAIYQWAADGWALLGVPMPYDPLLFVPLPDGRIAGLTYQGRLVQSTPDWRIFALAPTPNQVPEGMAFSALGVGPGRHLYFAPIGSMRVGRWDPEEDELTQPFVASRFVGEVTAIGFAGERLLMGFADTCGVTAFYPDLPYRLVDNPLLIGLVGEGQKRPIGPMVHHGSHVYFATDGAPGGAVVRVVPVDNTVTAFPGVLPGQGLTSLVVDRLNDLFVIGGYGPAGAQVALWSPFEARTLTTLVPFPDATSVRVWAAEGGRAYVTDGGVRYAIIDTAQGSILESGDFPLGTITSLINTLNGELYGLAGGWFFHWDTANERLETLAEATGEMLTEVRRDLFAFAHGGRIYTARVW